MCKETQWRRWLLQSLVRIQHAYGGHWRNEPASRMISNSIPSNALPYQNPSSFARSKCFSLKSKGNFSVAAPAESSHQVNVDNWRKNIELHHYHKRTWELKKMSTYLLTLTTSSANISAIAEQLSSECACFNNSEVILHDNDNLKIPSNSCTQGMYYTIYIIIYVHFVLYSCCILERV